MPVMVAPMAVAPTPVTVMPTSMAMMPAAVMPVPMHLLRLEPGCFLAAGDGGKRVRAEPRHADLAGDRLRRQRRGLRGRGECGHSNRDAEGEFQKVPAFH